MLGQKIIAQIILRLINAVIGFASAILVARAFLPEIIGEVAFIIGICSFAIMFFDLGFDVAANTKIAQGKFTPESNLGTLIYYKLILTIIYIILTIGVFFVNQDKIYEIGLSIFIMIVIALYIEGFSVTLQQYFVGQRHFYKFMINNFLAQFGSSVFLIVICLYFPTKFNYAAATFVKSVILIIILILYFRKIKIDWTIRKEILKDYFSYAKPLIVLTPIFYFIGSAERILLPYLISSFSLGIFTFGLKFYQLIQMAKKTFSQYIYTYVCNIIARFQGNKLWDKLNNLTIVTQIFATLLVVGLINRADFLTVLAFGENYAASAIVTKLMCLLLYTELIFSNNGHIIYAKAMQKKLIKWTIVGGLVLILSSIILIPEQLFGIKLLGLEYAGMPLAKLLRVLIPGATIGILLTRQLIGTAFLKTHFKFFIFFVLYLLLDYFLLSLGKNQWVWVFTSWLFGIFLYSGAMTKFFINQTIKTEIKNLLSIKKFKEGLRED